MKKIEMSWGDPVTVRRAFLNNCTKKNIFYNENDLFSMGYTHSNGNEQLIDLTKEIIKMNIGLNYKNIAITNGATGGVGIILKAYKQLGYEKCVTMAPPYFPLYPSIITSSGLNHIYDTSYEKSVFLIDSPSNPLSIIYNNQNLSFLNMPIVWDTAYCSSIYTDSIAVIPHEVIVGSYSKLTGMSGLRIGFIATNNDFLFDRISKVLESEYAGLDITGSDVLFKLLSNCKWIFFEKEAKNNLDNNKTEWSKLDKFFENPVNKNGMFHYSEIDTAFNNILEKANINYMTGSKCGTNDRFVRFNLAQDLNIVNKAVKTILKIDKIK